MEDAELAEKLLGEIGKKKDLGSKRTKDLLDTLSSSRITSLKEAISEIQSQIEFRENLHKEMLDSIEELKSTINNMTPPMTAENAKVIVEFQKKLVAAEEMKINEKLNCFRDIAQLKKELREWIREFRDKENRASLLGDLLSD
ncbi:hypothetical protein GF323_03040 [Candidatus Woesearchaeota archaeon]|nr:hypothetical protein [Candidatus Woesearchaeota archaeon]